MAAMADILKFFKRHLLLNHMSDRWHLLDRSLVGLTGNMLGGIEATWRFRFAKFDLSDIHEKYLTLYSLGYFRP